MDLIYINCSEVSDKQWSRGKEHFVVEIGFMFNRFFLFSILSGSEGKVNLVVQIKYYS